MYMDQLIYKYLGKTVTRGGGCSKHIKTKNRLTNDSNYHKVIKSNLRDHRRVYWKVGNKKYNI